MCREADWVYGRALLLSAISLTPERNIKVVFWWIFLSQTVNSQQQVHERVEGDLFFSEDFFFLFGVKIEISF